ncbi:ABC transporter ATP-binding protein [Phenylobacterium sp. LjRoot219]|uniref:ABC transporter ATP-binding protein n=1 Tax=Phenylobacterium sp. LjRoot219 TaxID=3342283 RepID=UPI003ECD7FC7
MATRPIGQIPGIRAALAAPFSPVRDLVQDLREGRALFAMARAHLGFLPVMALLAVLSSLFEGVGLTLVIPLVQSLGDNAHPATATGYLGLLQGFIDQFPPASRTATVLALIFAAVVAKSLFSYANMAVLGVVYGRISHSLRTAIFERILSIPLATVERRPAGKLLNTLNNETWRATDAVNLIFVTITSLATAVVFAGLLVLLSWKLALIAIGCMLLIPPVILLVSRRAKRLSKQALECNEVLAQQTWSTLNGLRTIHTFGREDYELTRFEKISDRVRGLFLKMALVSVTTGPITEIMVVGVLVLLILLVSAEFASLSTLVAFIALLYRLQPKLVSLMGVQSSLAGLHASIAAVSAVLQGPQPPIRAPVATPQKFDGPVSFRRVTFRYPEGDAPAIAELSLALPQAGLVAIVGPSGAGKSTLLDLLLGFQTPQSGEIRIGETPLTDGLAAAWRRHVGVVNQDPYIFDDTVRANILYGRPEASEREVIQAARAVAADDFVQALPRGYDTRVGERATQLSGGQRQRIALARALLRDPAVLVLDEATNSLDAPTERVFQNTLQAFAKQRAVVIVAHKFSTVAIADHVVVLHDGLLVEQGAPAALLQAGGPFARMFAGSPADLRETTVVVGAGRR